MADLRAIADPAERAVAAHRSVADATRTQRESGQVLREAIRELRAASKSHGDIAALLGVTRARAQQLAELRDRPGT